MPKVGDPVVLTARQLPAQRGPLAVTVQVSRASPSRILKALCHSDVISTRAAHIFTIRFLCVSAGVYAMWSVCMAACMSMGLRDNSYVSRSVRLSPSGLPARLHGASVQSDRRSLKCLETWRSFYPVPNCSPDVNNVVDISIAGIHMTYPTALVLLTTGALDKHVDESTLPLSDLTALCPAAVPAASAAYEYGVRHTATHELATVDRLANRLHSDMVYTGSKQRRRRYVFIHYLCVCGGGGGGGGIREVSLYVILFENNIVTACNFYT